MNKHKCGRKRFADKEEALNYVRKNMRSKLKGMKFWSAIDYLVNYCGYKFWELFNMDSKVPII